jgi:uncharacterized membrane protein YhiD involved in acid resistance
MDFSAITGGNPAIQTSIWLIIFASAMTFLLSIILVITYDKTSRQVSRPDHFIQSLMLMSIVTCTIMQSIGDSIALGFGIFGALAIIRFRTRISDPRDVAFVFATMAIGIACGVHSFINAVIGTIAFCLIVWIIRWTPFGEKTKLVGNLRLTTDLEGNGIESVINVLDNMASEYAIKRIRTKIPDEEGLRTEYEYTFLLNADSSLTSFSNSLEAINGIKVARITLTDQNAEETI